MKRDKFEKSEKANRMIKLLIISDDFTGALDTSVQLAANGAATYVIVGSQIDAATIASNIEVLVIDAETRHLKKEKAYQIVYSIVREAQKINIPHIYKKTDSALRGNIGAELTAVLKASGAGHIHFIPAFPEMGRTTVDGIHYVNGIPVAQSVFGSDPFEPVSFSSIPEIIAAQSSVETHIVEAEQKEQHAGKKGILIHDTKCNEDFEKIASGLMKIDDLHLIAGCAGFACILPQVLQLRGKQPQMPKLDPRMFIVCGSINPVSIAQCEYAERQGAPRFRLTPEQKLDPEWVKGSGADLLIREISDACGKDRVVILDTNGPGDPAKTDAYAGERGMLSEQIRTRVVSIMGYLVERLIDGGFGGTVFFMGGDLLFQFIKQAEIKAVIPVGELECGVVLSQVLHKGKKMNIISKSGGFGNQTLFMDLSATLNNLKNRKEK